MKKRKQISNYVREIKNKSLVNRPITNQYFLDTNNWECNRYEKKPTLNNPHEDFWVLFACLFIKVEGIYGGEGYLPLYHRT